MIVLIDGIRYRLVIPDNEDDLEKTIKSNFKHIFGPDSFYFDVKKLIKSKAGVASIPDGYVILFEPKARWCILEVELASHSIYDHLVPQLTKFNRGIENSSSRKKIVEILYTAINENEVLKARLKQQIRTGEIYKFISDLISENPLIVVAIDQRTDELEESLRDIRGEIKAIEFRTFQREGIVGQINAYVFDPIFKEREQVKQASLAGETKQLALSGRRGTIINAVYGLFDEKGVDNVTYEECETLAKRIKPNTAFNKNHFSWYKRDYRIKRESNNKTSIKKDITAPASYHEDCIIRISDHLNKEFVRKRKSLYFTSKNDARLVCLVSKAYISDKNSRYWYGFDPSHKDFLLERENAFVAFGCGSADKVILMSAKIFIPFLDNMNKTETVGHSHWHVKIKEENHQFYLEQVFGHDAINISAYFLR